MNQYVDETFGKTELILKKFKNNYRSVELLSDMKLRTKERLQTLDVIYASDMGLPNSETYIGSKTLVKLYERGGWDREAKLRRRNLAQNFFGYPKRRSSLIDDTRWKNVSGPYGPDEVKLLSSIFSGDSDYVYRDRQNRKVYF